MNVTFTFEGYHEQHRINRAVNPLTPTISLVIIRDDFYHYHSFNYCYHYYHNDYYNKFFSLAIKDVPLMVT